MNLQSSTLIEHESELPFHLQQLEQIQAYRAAWADAGHPRDPRVSVSRSIMPITSDQDRISFGGRSRDQADQVGSIGDLTAVFGRSYTGEPDQIAAELARDEAVRDADTLLITLPTQMGVAYNAHIIETILADVAPALGWRPPAERQTTALAD
jgi:alkanesulfonate monooxygenase SsuD/methylene tetrahydromethanopterin reductase-like flavin-dependent oxidoreductase (luciferase family)